MKKIVLVFIVLGGVWFLFRGFLTHPPEELTNIAVNLPQAVPEIANTNATPTVPATAEETTDVPQATNPSAQKGRLPDEVNLAVPFTSQAPFANWDHTHEEACEEAAALMVHRYWSKNSFADKQDAENALQALVAFQIEHYGFFESTTAEETAQFIKDRWGYTNVDLLTDPTVDQLKQELADGFPIIVPAAGRQLGNPNYKQPGPLYHMLVIKGYTADGMFITNDPGTRRGADYTYRPDVLIKAIHDWNGGKVESGRKVVVLVRP